MPRPRAITLLTLAIVLAGIAISWTYARSFLPFIADDGLISLRYSERLLDGRGLTWTDGERVEGYSNLLWVLAAAGVARVGSGDLIVAARGLGFAGIVAVMAALGFAFRPRRWPEAASLLAGILVVALAAPMAVWAIGGLEQALVAPLLAWAIALGLPVVDRESKLRPTRLLGVGVPLALLCLTRPDGPLFTAAFCLALLVTRGPTVTACKNVLLLALLPIGCTGAQVIFRLAYYDDWVPNSAHAKLSLTAARLKEGLIYVSGGTRALPILVVALVASCMLLSSRARARHVLFLSLSLTWLSYVTVVGGDIFPAYRHLVPVIVVAAFAVSDAVAWLVGRFGDRTWALPSTVLIVGLVALLTCLPTRDGEIQRAREERWEWEGDAVGTMLGHAFAKDGPLLAVDTSGCLPFFSKLPSLDMLGLNDRFLATHRPADFGQGHLGHELGNGAYVLSRSPDLILFCGPLGSATPCFRSGREMFATSSFQTDHQLVHLETPAPRSLHAAMWVRKEGRVGIHREGDIIRVPGFMLAHDEASSARAGADGRIHARATADHPARLQRLRLREGTWWVTAHADGPVRVKVNTHPAAGPDARGKENPNPVRVTLATPAAIDVEVWALSGQERMVFDLIAGPKPPESKGTR